MWEPTPVVGGRRVMLVMLIHCWTSRWRLLAPVPLINHFQYCSLIGVHWSLIWHRAESRCRWRTMLLPDLCSFLQKVDGVSLLLHVLQLLLGLVQLPKYTPGIVCAWAASASCLSASCLSLSCKAAATCSCKLWWSASAAASRLSLSLIWRFAASSCFLSCSISVACWSAAAESATDSGLPRPLLLSVSDMVITLHTLWYSQFFHMALWSSLLLLLIWCPDD